MPNDPASLDDLFHKVNTHTASASELVLFLRLLEDPEVQERWTRFQEWEQAPEQALPDGLRDRLVLPPAANEPSAAPRKPLYRKILPYAAAAALVLLVRLFLPRAEGPYLLTAVTGDGEIRTVILPDSTTVKLNARSSLRYSENAATGERIVQLEGQGFFIVRDDAVRPFVVQSGLLKTQVLGTSFDVRAYPGVTPMVAVVSGKVKVSDNTGQSILLSKGLRATYDEHADRFSKFAENPASMSAWQQKLIDMQGLSLREVCSILETGYGVTIDLQPGIENFELSGHQANTSLQSTLESICFIFNLRFEQKGKTIYIRQQ
ncbi:FecR family protein [Chitinophaga sp. GCM10012297]|uniref:FecR domain-containing protein n=1 Tax=Chitinophaga chungangae TaxID=2821488 RepID=A0ABS3YJX5_9BACT|nr:FecR domain-containing protein [Chitinophaga chungangae]MBO9154985.1 FecR domain-containing protein [Chitinophaga chungangae]